MKRLTIALCGLLLTSTLPLSVSSQNPPLTLQQVRQIKLRHRDSLLALPGVQGVGIGREGDQFFLGVLVNESRGRPALPTTLEGVPVKQIASGPIVPFQNLPVLMGSSTSNDLVSECTTGTLGFKVRDALVPSVVGYVTNNHIATSYCWNGDGFNQLHPGLYDTNCVPATIIGTLDRFIHVNVGSPVPTTADAAFVDSDNSLTSREIGCGIGFPTITVATQEQLIGQTVRKCGRTTGFTQGPVTLIFFDVGIDDCFGGFELFVDQIRVDSLGFAAQGDSGSPVLTMGNDPVGLVFAGEVGPGVTYIAPLDVILSELQLELLAPITVVRPNGGENWTIGSTQTLQWTSSGVSGNVKIELSRDGGSTFETLFASTLNDDFESWTVTGPASTNCVVRISDPAGQASDTSDAPFTISSTPPTSITVVTPNGGEVWNIGQSREIRWTSSGVSGNVKIELSRNAGRTWQTLFANTPNDGSQFWQVTGPATPTALVRVSSVNNPSIQDVSNSTFRIQ